MLYQTLVPVALLFCSNVFMIFAWYWHLKFPHTALWMVILISWGIAFVEYCLAVPANRIGYGFFSAAELRTLQVFISLTVFCAFSVFYLHERVSFYHITGFLMIACGSALVFLGGKGGA